MERQKAKRTGRIGVMIRATGVRRKALSGIGYPLSSDRTTGQGARERTGLAEFKPCIIACTRVLRAVEDLRMTRRRRVVLGLVALSLALTMTSLVLERISRVNAAGVMAPRFEVDPLWPKPLPNHWLLGNVIGVGIDAQDHIWIVHRQGSLEAMENYAAANPPGPKRQPGVVESECCAPAPPVLEFDEAGNLIGHWGGPGEGYDWPETNHGIFIDYKGNVWIGGNGRPAPGTAGRGTAGAAGRAGRGAATPNES